ncbi:MAG: CRISPR-associated endoribonuclease Cas6 [Candidatus Brocadia sp.]|nr:CRISPR-associated endoribonuclease Cas6 [Candidatus Brocadia sp.]
MRIRITLSADRSGVIVFNYQHQIQAIIYGFLSRSNPDYAQWLHQQGFIYKKDKRFKLFVFSGIIFDGPIKIIRLNNTNHSNNVANQYNMEESPRLAKEGDRGWSKSLGITLGVKQPPNSLTISTGFSFKASQTHPFTFSFQIASPVDKFIQHLIDGIFREGNEITLGRQKITIYRIETLPDPVAFNSEIQNPKSEILLKPLESPIFIKKPMPPGRQDIFLFPGDEGYAEFLNQNLLHKYETLHGKLFGGEPLKFDFHTINGKSVKQFTIFKKGSDGSKKPVNIKGTLQPFTVTGAEELIRIGLECGFGQNNSMGCGYVEMNRDGQDRQDKFVETQYLASLKQR